MFTGIAKLIDQYDLFIVDLWGVLHNGKVAFPKALEALEFIKNHSKQVLLLSNAPRRLHLSKQRLLELGVHQARHYDCLYTSGEDTYLALKDEDHPLHQQSKKFFYHLGPARDETLFEGLPSFRQTKTLSEADFVILTGTLGWGESLDDYTQILDEFLSLKLPLVCANPDRIVCHGETLSLCGGALAQAYEEKGGTVYWHGKPYKKFYERALSDFSIPFNRILAIGDSLQTDILGAYQSGLDSLLVLSGIYGPQTQDIIGDNDKLEAVLQSLYKDFGVKATYVNDCFGL